LIIVLVSPKGFAVAVNITVDAADRSNRASEATYIVLNTTRMMLGNSRSHRDHGKGLTESRQLPGLGNKIVSRTE
jgi:hypothetical protein